MPSRFASIAFLLAFLAVSAASAFAIDPFDFSTPREKSMGGRHAALADDFSVLLSNPAGLADMPRKFSVADLGIQAMGPVFDIADLIVGGLSSNTAVTDFLAANDYKLYAGAQISGPLAFGYTGGGLGFGLFNKTSLTINVASASSIGVNAREDLLLTGGYAVRLDLGNGHEIAGGVSAKGFLRGELAPTMGIVEAVGFASDPSALLSDTFTLTSGIGVDLGLRWSWNGRVAAALVYRDAYSPAIVSQYASVSDFVSPSSTSPSVPSTYETLKPSMDFGLMWAPSLGRLGEVIDSLVFALDYRDILDLASSLPRNPILNVGLGLEARVLDIVTLRAGINEALLCAGAGIDIGVCTLSIAAYGAELGLDPGDRPYYNLLVDFDFKF